MSRIKAICLITGVIFGLAMLCGPISQQTALAKSKEVSSPGVVLLEQGEPPAEESELEEKPEPKIEFGTK